MASEQIGLPAFEEEQQGVAQDCGSPVWTPKIRMSPVTWRTPLSPLNAQKDNPWATATSDAFKDPRTNWVPDHCPDKVYIRGGKKVLEWQK
uniref:Uncharacterized protein n=1 Tax=Chromera velia CCMP2878 TaxID=1169474 RepID=A0A0G4IFN0_9ALVE|mmetsp:Transcript_47540/g.93788  ORF Transcript_47540/g.93788 Transcript_47540/m.93788 type:complete len:91 (+) Transcript_47540:160-432(+)|eukprot:Cvel_13944.t1-p1 / transcript=Cvel_13944.t1 / gene=Cvel_13944 / organism=Chromera_velia_CCMP2878 / gene_product=hypothetical protein / transcript_product=hypothetical protein / location=Cvel_scaffold973:47535-49197(-) / protein_length=90 / sequence_SO=supercontig / SO=protein_coding / is_pseudo=false